MSSSINGQNSKIEETAGASAPLKEARLNRLTPAFMELLKAFDYAKRSGRAVWDFAVEITELRPTGLTETDFRWLVYMGYVSHRREITRLEDDERIFRSSGRVIFSRRTCFVLTKEGVSVARSLVALSENTSRSHQTQDAPDRYPATRSNIPSWDGERHELRLNGRVVKQFKWTAANQEMILAAFEEDGWPHRIDDPLPPQPEQDSKRRLHDTIKSLNRNRTTPLIHFRGDGTGEGVLWDLVHTVFSANGGRNQGLGPPIKRGN